MNRACHAFGVANQRGRLFCGRIHFCGQRGNPYGFTVARRGGRTTTVDDSLQQRATFHVKHDACAVQRQAPDTPQTAHITAFLEHH